MTNEHVNNELREARARVKTLNKRKAVVLKNIARPDATGLAELGAVLDGYNASKEILLREITMLEKRRNSNNLRAAKEAFTKTTKVDVFIRDISNEPMRKYSWICPLSGVEGDVTITDLATVSFHKGCTTHKVTKKDGTILYVPAPGVFGCIVEVV